MTIKPTDTEVYISERTYHVVTTPAPQARHNARPVPGPVPPVAYSFPMTIRPDESRFDIGPTERRGIEAFNEYLRHNPEVCNHCFSRVRSVGELKERRTDLFVHEFNEHYERTERGSQEHDPFELPSDRYGQCYCRECGSDLSVTHDELDFETFKEYVRNCYRYVREHTPLDVDHQRLGREAARLKRRRDTQGRDRQIIAVAFARALNDPPAVAKASQARAD